MNYKIYWNLTTAYGTGRAAYWMPQVNDFTITKDGIKKHPPTLTTYAVFSICSGFMSPLLWPIFMLSDISRYEKSKMGIRDKNPPYPFEHFTWRDEK